MEGVEVRGAPQLTVCLRPVMAEEMTGWKMALALEEKPEGQEASWWGRLETGDTAVFALRGGS